MDCGATQKGHRSFGRRRNFTELKLTHQIKWFSIEIEIKTEIDMQQILTLEYFNFLRHACWPLNVTY